MLNHPVNLALSGLQSSQGRIRALRFGTVVLSNRIRAASAPPDMTLCRVNNLVNKMTIRNIYARFIICLKEFVHKS